MLNRFLSYIKQNKLIIPGSFTLLAVSGGKDSMVMVDLMHQAGLPIHIGHINHHLRGQESDDDARFVEDYCKKKQIPYHQYDIDPYLLSHGNLQDKARIIRYEKLVSWAIENDCQQIATAHHLDDQIETFIMYLMRGAGLNGLKGIAKKNGVIIRPLLWASSEEIIQYANEHSIQYREDSSNTSDKYVRNQIRHHILPTMYQTDSRAHSGIKQTIRNIESTVSLFDFLLESYSRNIVSYDCNLKTINLQEIISHPSTTDLLFHLLKQEGFNIYQCADMVKSQQGHFYSSTHEAIVYRQQIIVRLLTKRTSLEPIIIANPPYEKNINNHKFSVKLTNIIPDTLASNNHLYLDANVIHWPLTIRERQDGDFFSPFGLKGQRQKVKDFLINRKLSAFDKEDILIVEDTEQIVAVLPMTIAHHTSIDKNTTSLLCIQYH